jgi:hypothetical protein
MIVFYNSSTISDCVQRLLLAPYCVPAFVDDGSR